MTAHKLTKHLVDIPNCPDWIHFFVIFSRFEYALKSSSYVKNGHYVKADWHKFGEDVEEKFNCQDCDDLSEAIEYLKKSPPKTQVLSGGKLSWDNQPKNENEMQQIILAVKQVRNNLFHGGKEPSGLVTEPSRDNELIRHSITVLKYLLHSSDKVRGYYYKSLEKEQT